MMDQMLSEIIQRESVKDTDNPNDSGGRTKYGISQKWHPDVWAKGPPTLEQAKSIYFSQYVVQPGFLTIAPDYLQAQLVDIAVTSGPQTAIQKLQEVLKVAVDGVLGPATLNTLRSRNPLHVNNDLVDARVLMMARIVQRRSSNLEFLFGWQRRALTFRQS